MALLPSLRDRRIRKEAARWQAEMLEPPTPELRAEFDAWLAADPAHARAYRELDRLAVLSRHLPRPGRRRRHRVPGGGGLRPAFALAAIAAIAGSGVLLMTGREAPTHSVIANAGPAIRLFRLADGSTITLDVDTELDVAMKPASREVRLRSGRARFKVINEPSRPFRVESAGGRVTATGGEFDVALDGERMTVVPLAGDMQVSPAGASEAGAVPVARGNAVRIDGAAIAAISVSREDRLWPAGRLSFDKTALEQIIATANRLGGPPIRLGTEGLGTLKVTAVLDLRDTRALARKLAAALDLKAIESDGEVVLTR